MSGVGVLAVLDLIALRNINSANAMAREDHRHGADPWCIKECRERAAEANAVRDAVAELIEAADEVERDAGVLGMDIPRLSAALRRVQGAA